VVPVNNYGGIFLPPLRIGIKAQILVLDLWNGTFWQKYRSHQPVTAKTIQVKNTLCRLQSRILYCNNKIHATHIYFSRSKAFRSSVLKTFYPDVGTKKKAKRRSYNIIPCIIKLIIELGTMHNRTIFYTYTYYTYI